MNRYQKTSAPVKAYNRIVAAGLQTIWQKFSFSSIRFDVIAQKIQKFIESAYKLNKMSFKQRGNCFDKRN